MLQNLHRAVTLGVSCSGRCTKDITRRFRSNFCLSQRSDLNNIGTSRASASPWHNHTSVMASSSDSQPTQEKEPEPPKTPKLVVFGGNGFVGSRVCEAGVNRGFNVVSINRSGKPGWLQNGWGDKVDWVVGDCLQPSTYTEALKEAAGVVTCVGGFGTNDFMYQICGETNIRVAETAAAVGVPRLAFISVHEYNLPGTSGIGYFKGKKDAEETIMKYFGNSGVFLKPGIIHGTRYVNNVGIPLGAVFGPLEKVLGFLPNKELSSIPLVGAALVPPVSAEAVGKAAVAAATDESVPGGAMDVWEIAKYS